ncbi:hypothetical protein A3A93_02220 [Candidatus Roizmanbacteria bacterium RIFCSPLOWO2_01_FULL_38_12]|uniref:20S proteasome subunit A/B n=1 Tax=Candidatus Roizmanbacteria bacterium RIFCSPLOWO2_01_FULL_38_12 TaxID=1802061 RepID=A0A1F7IY28_9BACT|nr:MAG: hypothetical protein A3A93_02220 [Candidatus Roizmanbacteria bacterium RIFCSPLOWO2_01_FULL_38_12]
MTLVIGIIHKNGIAIVSDGLNVIQFGQEAYIQTDFEKVHNYKDRFLVGVSMKQTTNEVKNKLMSLLDSLASKDIRTPENLALKMAEAIPSFFKEQPIPIPKAGVKLLVAGFNRNSPEIYIVKQAKDTYRASKVNGHYACVGEGGVANPIMNDIVKSNLEPAEALVQGLLVIKMVAQGVWTVAGKTIGWQITEEGVSQLIDVGYINPQHDVIMDWYAQRGATKTMSKKRFLRLVKLASQPVPKEQDKQRHHENYSVKHRIQNT